VYVHSLRVPESANLLQLGLAAVPFLPYMFDEPVEHATEWLFYNGFKLVGGEKAVEGRPVTGSKELRKEESQATKLKEL
jgi:fission process protein 1